MSELFALIVIGALIVAACGFAIIVHKQDEHK